jgi:hypothetical protein
MLKPHFYIAHKIGIFCKHFKSWFRLVQANIPKTQKYAFLNALTAVVTDMSRPHFDIVDKLGIFCKHIICWFG